MAASRVEREDKAGGVPPELSFNVRRGKGAKGVAFERVMPTAHEAWAWWPRLAPPQGGCGKLARGNSDACFAHGGGTRCTVPGCAKSGRGASAKCIAHGETSA